MIKNVYIDSAVSVLGAIATIMFGRLDWLLAGIVICMVIDYISGMIASYSTKTWNSEKGFVGILKKALILLIIIMAVVLDHVLGTTDLLFRNMVITFFIANECLSILENAGNCGLPIPQKLLDVLEQVKTDADEGGNDEQKTI